MQLALDGAQRVTGEKRCWEKRMGPDWDVSVFHATGSRGTEEFQGSYTILPKLEKDSPHSTEHKLKQKRLTRYGDDDNLTT